MWWKVIIERKDVDSSLNSFVNNLIKNQCIKANLSRKCWKDPFSFRNNLGNWVTGDSEKSLVSSFCSKGLRGWPPPQAQGLLPRGRKFTNTRPHGQSSGEKIGPEEGIKTHYISHQSYSSQLNHSSVHLHKLSLFQIVNCQIVSKYVGWVKS